MPPGLLGPKKEHDRAEVLKMFFELRDRKCVPIVNVLFKLYTFQDIVTGVYAKYDILPAGWHMSIRKLKDEKDKKLEWLDLQSRSLKWLTEFSSKYPTIKKTHPPHREAEIDKVVDEFVENEHTYFVKIRAMVSYYIAEIKAISEAKLGPHAQAALGLTSQEVDYIFGPLTKVLKAVEVFQVLIETITLVNADPLTSDGRQGQLAEIFCLAGPGLVEAYAPFNATYMDARVMCDEKRMNAPTVEAEPNEIKLMNFHEIWKEISASKKVLNGMAIDGILILPVRRFPNYLMYLNKLIKDAKKSSHPSLTKLEEAVKKVQRFTNEINDAAGGN